MPAWLNPIRAFSRSNNQNLVGTRDEQVALIPHATARAPVSGNIIKRGKAWLAKVIVDNHYATTHQKLFVAKTRSVPTNYVRHNHTPIDLDHDKRASAPERADFSYHHTEVIGPNGLRETRALKVLDLPDGFKVCKENINKLSEAAANNLPESVEKLIRGDESKYFTREDASSLIEELKSLAFTRIPNSAWESPAVPNQNVDPHVNLNACELHSLVAAVISAARIQKNELTGDTRALDRISPGDAAKALEELRQIDLLSCIRDLERKPDPQPGNIQPITPLTAERGLAWGIAQELAKKPNGISILKKITPAMSKNRLDKRTTYLTEKLANRNVPGHNPLGENEIKTRRFEERYEHIVEKVTKQEDRLLGFYLIAMSEKKRESKFHEALGGGPIINDCDPQSLKEHRNERHDQNDPALKGLTLLDKGLIAISKHLADCESLLDNLRTSPDEKSASALEWIALQPREEGRAPIQELDKANITPRLMVDPSVFRCDETWAIGAIKDQVYTDKLLDENGNPTPFAIQTKHAERVEKWGQQAVEQAKEGVKTFKDRIYKYKNVVKRSFLSTCYKSPFSALCSISAKQAKTGTHGKSNIFGVSGAGTIGESRDMKRALEITAEKLRDKIGLPPLHTVDPDRFMRDRNQQPFTPSPELANTLVRIAAIEQAVQEPTNFWFCATSNTMGVQDGIKRLDNRVNELASLCGITDVADNQHFINAKANLKQNDPAGNTPRQGVMLEDLMAWAADKSGGAPDPRPGKPVPQYITRNNMRYDNPWYEWANAMKRGYGELPYIKTDTTFLNTQELGSTIGKGIKQTELGSAVTLIDGGGYGLSTKGASMALTSLATLFAGAIRADLRCMRSKHAVFEFAVGAHASEITMGIDKGMQYKAGIGAQAGPPSGALGSLSKVISLNGKLDFAYGYARTKRKGIVMRFDRTEAGFAGDPKNNEKMAKVTQMLMNPRSASSQGVTNQSYAIHEKPNLLKDIWQACPDISISTIKEKEGAHTWSAALSAAASVSIPLSLSVSPGVGGGLGAAPKHVRTNRNHVETGGSLTTQQANKSKETSWGFSASGVAALIVKPDTTSNVGELLKNIGVPIIDLVEKQAHMARRGGGQYDTIITKDGLTHKLSNRVVAYQTAQECVDEAKKHLQEYATTRFVKYESNLRFRELSYAPNPNERKEVFADDAERDATFSGRINDKNHEFQKGLIAILDEQHPSKIYKEYLELSEKATQYANLISTAMADYAALGDNASVAECEGYLAALHAHPGSWDRSFLVFTEREAMDDKFMLSLGIATSRTSSIATKNICIGV